MRVIYSLLVVTVTFALWLPVAHAAPLEPAACERLRIDMSALEKSGARINLSKGAAWAKANLKADQLQQIEQLIDSEAQFLFRCPQPKRQFDPTTEALMENGTGSDPDPDAPKPDAAAATAAPKAAAKPTAKPRPVPKPKVVDAFTPPEPATKAAGAPVAKQLAPQ